MTDKDNFLTFILPRLDYRIANEFDSIRDYIVQNDSLIRSEQIRIEKLMNKDLKKYKHDPDSIGAIEAHYGQDMFRAFDFANILLSSTFTACCSLFESLLREVCIITYPRSHKLTVDDISGNGNVDRYRKFLNKVIGLELDKYKDTLSEMTPYHELRNKIVHEYSNYWSKREKPVEQSHLHQFIINNPNLSAKGNGDFKIKDKQFILDYCVHAEHYLNQVLELLQEKASTWKHNILEGTFRYPKI